MAKTFKLRRTPFKVWLGVIIVIIALILLALETENYWNLMPIIFPVLLLADELMARIIVQDNGDIQREHKSIRSDTHCPQQGLMAERKDYRPLYQRLYQFRP